ncbi:MAG: hypothetical protein ACR2KG_03580 [Nocardioidaceae bacterium]
MSTATTSTALSPYGKAGPGTVNGRRLGYLGAGWALSYLPIHVYWALGRSTAWLGVTESGPGWRAANWGACVVIAGAGLTCLALVRRWGDVLPAALRHGVAWVGGVLGIAHWAVFSAVCALRLAGLVDYPDSRESTVAQLQRFDWANLLYFEPWFAVMGVLLIACSRHARRRDKTNAAAPAPARAPAPPQSRSAWRRGGAAVTMAGIAVVVWGVFTFDPWVFAGYGPALMAVGVLAMAVPAAISRTRSSRERSHR